MKIAAIVCLAVGIVAAVAGIVLQAIKIKKSGNADKRTILTIAFALFYIVFAVVNLVFVVPML